MEQDPFGNLMDWGQALETLEKISASGGLVNCQPGLIRILRFKSNWRLREEVLKRLTEVEAPSKALIFQVLDLLADDNLYYDARVIAGQALIDLLNNAQADACDELNTAVRKVVQKLSSTPQPPFFNDALGRLHGKIATPLLSIN